MRRTREERTHFVEGDSLEEVGKAVDKFIREGIEPGWRLQGVGLGADVYSYAFATGDLVGQRVRYAAGVTIHRKLEDA